MVDPFDEIAFLCVECERLGAAWAGEYLRRRIMHALHDSDSEELFVFYRCHRATLRARLAVAHLLEPNPRDAGKMGAAGAHAICRLAAADAVRLERMLRRPEDRSVSHRHAGAERPRPRAALPQLYRSWSARPRRQVERPGPSW